MKKQAFTLVELIVVITILAILATIGFVSFSGYLAGTRDVNRTAQLKAMSDALELYSTKKSLPIPDDKVDIKANTKIIAYQGYIGKGVLETIEYTESGLDPKDKSYFSYYLTKNKKYFQLLAFLEETNEDVVALNSLPFSKGTLTSLGHSKVPEGGGIRAIEDAINGHLYNSTFAIDYSDRFPKVTGKKLGIITDENNTPLQEIESIKTAGEINLQTSTSTVYKSIISNDEIISGSGTTLAGTSPTASCKRIKQIKGSSNDGVYTIDPESNGTGFKVYCDMTTDGGGWTLVSYAGKINSTKALTTGESNKGWMPLIFSWGNVESDSLKSGKSFSRFDIVKSIAKPIDEIMVRRTSVQDNIIIFPIQNVEWFGRQFGEGHFTINSTNRNLPYLKLSNNGIDNFKTVNNNVKWSYLNSSSSSYPGIDWNVPEGDNCDNCGRDYNTGLNHRSLLYWEVLESGYASTQWFHGSPISLKDSTSPTNDSQDIEFWWR